jgi:hypothetical protein
MPIAPNTRAVEALNPFADAAARWDDPSGVSFTADNVELWQNGKRVDYLTVGDLRLAREARAALVAALEREEGEKEPKPGELRIEGGKLLRFIERELEGDKWEVLEAFPAPLPAPGAWSVEQVWEALKRQCAATRPNSPEWDKVNALVTVSRTDVAKALSTLNAAPGAGGGSPPDVLPGHWETPEGREMAAEYASKERADLAMGKETDLGLANLVYMVDRNSLDLIAFQTAAKERIRWLSAQLAIARQAPPAHDQPKGAGDDR